jgi:hypothetical protein
MPTSVAFLDVSQFATYSRFMQTPDYIDSDAPPVKFQFLLRFNIVVQSRRIANNTGWHPKTPVHRRELWLAATPKGYGFVSDNSQVD